MKLKDCLADFKTHLQADGKSRLTIRAYLQDLNLLSEWFNVEDITTDKINCFLASDKVRLLNDSNKERSFSSINRLKSSLKTFFRWLEETGKIEKNPAMKIKMKRQNGRHPEILTKEEIKALLSSIKAGGDGIRDHTIFNLFLNTGLRVSELCSLKVEDVKGKESLQLKERKSKNLSPIPLNPTIRQELARFLKWKERRGEPIVDDSPLFISRKKNPISPVTVWYNLKKWLALAGINKRISPHSLRHTFGTYAYLYKRDIRTTQSLLGHSSISSTMIYTHLTDKMREETVNNLGY